MDQFLQFSCSLQLNVVLLVCVTKHQHVRHSQSDQRQARGFRVRLQQQNDFPGLIHRQKPETTQTQKFKCDPALSAGSRLVSDRNSLSPSPTVGGVRRQPVDAGQTPQQSRGDDGKGSYRLDVHGNGRTDRRPT